VKTNAYCISFSKIILVISLPHKRQDSLTKEIKTSKRNKKINNEKLNLGKKNKYSSKIFKKFGRVEF